MICDKPFRLHLLIALEPIASNFCRADPNLQTHRFLKQVKNVFIKYMDHFIYAKNLSIFLGNGAFAARGSF